MLKESGAFGGDNEDENGGCAPRKDPEGFETCRRPFGVHFELPADGRPGYPGGHQTDADTADRHADIGCGVVEQIKKRAPKELPV